MTAFLITQDGAISLDELAEIKIEKGVDGSSAVRAYRKNWVQPHLIENEMKLSDAMVLVASLVSEASMAESNIHAAAHVQNARSGS